MTTTIAEYSKTDAALAELAHAYKGVVYEVNTKLGMEEARKGRAELRTYRVDLEKLRKEIKAPALLRCQQIDSEARRITAELESLENPIHEQIKIEENRVEEEKNAVARAEQERIMSEQRAIKDAEEAKMAADRAEIERQKAELAASQKVVRDQIEAQERAARMRIEEEERKARMEREEADRQARIVREAEDAKAKVLRDAEEAAQREIQRKEAELSDAKGMLKLFRDRYKHLPEFAGIIAAINEYARSIKK